MIRLAIQRTLERGVSPNVATSMLARAWADRARVARPLASKVPALCVSGATLGGSGKTPLAIACARFLAREGMRVALVGHAYGARPPWSARRVRVDDDVRVVGDEAIECARAIACDRVTVLVAREKQTALDAAAEIADVVVLDGPLQLEPARATLALLAVDPRAPWGSGACPPLGNLRARKEALTSAADAIVPVALELRGARHDAGELVSARELRAMRVGLTTAIARPDRVLTMLEAHGIRPDPILTSPDHGALRFSRAPVDLWLTTPKDSVRAKRTSVRVATLDYHFDLPSEVVELLRSRFLFRF